MVQATEHWLQEGLKVGERCTGRWGHAGGGGKGGNEGPLGTVCPGYPKTRNLPCLLQWLMEVFGLFFFCWKYKTNMLPSVSNATASTCFLPNKTKQRSLVLNHPVSPCARMCVMVLVPLSGQTIKFNTMWCAMLLCRRNLLIFPNIWKTLNVSGWAVLFGNSLLLYNHQSSFTALSLNAQQTSFDVSLVVSEYLEWGLQAVIQSLAKVQNGYCWLC